MRFSGKVVIVTGGAAGIGAGCARVFAREEGQVAILDRNLAVATKTAADINATTKGTAACFDCNVGDPFQVQAVIEAVVTKFGRLDALINNAGFHPPAQTIDDTSIDDLEAVLRVNFVGTFAAAKFAAPHLRRTRGTIINISSMTAVLGQDKSAAYAASKGAQLSFTKALALELGGAGVRVNAVLPGNVDTPLMREWAATLDDPQSALERVAGLQIFGRMADPEEIGRVCLFLATDDSSFMTGQGIEVDGGASLDY